MALKKAQLVEAAEELNGVLELDPPFDTELSVADLKTELKEVAEDLIDAEKDSGKFTQATLSVLEECGASLPDGLEPKGGKQKKSAPRSRNEEDTPKKPTPKKRPSRPTPSKKKAEEKAKPKKKAAPKGKAAPKKKAAAKAKSGNGRIDRKACAFQAIRQMCKRKNGATKGEVLAKTQEIYYQKGGQAEKYPPLHVLYYSIDALVEFGVLEKDERGQYKFA